MRLFYYFCNLKNQTSIQYRRLQLYTLPNILGYDLEKECV